ncbi:Melibiose operon regulatory protein [Rubripirellula lacrimiformis]|uniref:Melibiose operon regulatory protein n=1 Tax=Rubripirellula lacrimiformis TaxID=1930273 RepID=A0A517NF73_9BACT|nr:AraC family transcriptional regulator [Rubripirellula lacrimiformis]QDT05780.1 Melibiose operon regulatory protein [Rubripirellula lacrimiformis]
MADLISTSASTTSILDPFFDSLDDVASILRLFDFVPDVYVYIKNRDGQFVAGNKPWLRMRGANSIADVVGKTDRELHPLFWARQYQEEDRRVMDSGCELPEQIWLVPSENGKLKTFISTKIPLRSGGGDVIGIAGVMHSAAKTSAPIDMQDPIAQATELIAKRFRGSLTVAEIASAVGLSVSQLNRRFRTNFQVPPSEYLQRVRVHHAGCMLSDTDAPISEVALDTGFFDQAHLTRTFRRWLGMTPTEFRRSFRHQGGHGNLPPNSIAPTTG